MIRNLFDITSQRMITNLGVITVVAIAVSFSQVAHSATISYGDFGPVPPGVSFLDVEESSGTDAVPLYGPPDPFITGLDFDPMNFVATTAGGGVDLTDGQLNFTVMSDFPITEIDLFERGDFTLSGTGTATTEVEAGAVLLATVTAINGVAVAPINLLPVNGSVGFNLAANPGPVQPWSLGLGLNVAAQVAGATKIDVVINNALVAVSEPSSVAFIAKKDFIITVETVPEPTSAIVALVGAAIGCVVIRRRKCALAC